MCYGEEGARGWAGDTAPVLSVVLHTVRVPKLHLLVFPAEVRGRRLQRAGTCCSGLQIPGGLVERMG